MSFLSSFIKVALLVGLAACAKTPQTISIAEQALLDRPSPDVMAKVEEKVRAQLPKQVEFEAYILQKGRPLNRHETVLAKRVGVKNTNRIRMLIVPHIPTRNTADRLISHTPIKKPAFRFSVIGGLQAGYGLVIDEAYLRQDWLLAHELAHVRQFEKLGRKNMLRQVLIQHEVLDGKLIPIEREAIELSEAATGTKAPNYHR